MEQFGASPFEGAVRKKRSQTSRRPRPDSHSLVETRDSTPPSDDVRKISSDDNGGSKRKQINLNQCEKTQKKSKKRDGGFNIVYNSEPGHSGYNNIQTSEPVLAPANWTRNGETQLGPNFDALGNGSNLKKFKLKVGGVTRTIRSNGVPPGGSSKGSQSLDDSRLQQKPVLQGNSEDVHSSVDKRDGLQAIPWKDFSRGSFGFGKEDSLMSKNSGKNSSGRQGDNSGPVRKRKRANKRRALDGEFEDDDDDEIRYLEKLKTSKVHTGYKEDDEVSVKKQRKLSSLFDLENVGTSRSDQDGKEKPRPDRVSGDTDYEDKEEPVTDVEVEGSKKKQKEYVDSLMDNKKEMTLTTRQRALQSSKDASSNLIEFPNGLPPAPSRKQKEKLTEVEQQLKKAEAAQRRRMQVEKANRESEAEAIRKILGQESKRTKREEQKKKRQKELADEKAATALMHASSTIRWVMGPTGTVVTFPKEMGFPSIFDSRPCSYPLPRENCAGPSCTNPYKYRDSKFKLPLCSLQCYKAIQEKLQAETTS